jgi:putative transposase
VAARTRATAPSAWPEPDRAPQPPTEAEATGQQPEPEQEQEQSLADVVPLAVFDARKEAKNWW